MKSKITISIVQMKILSAKRNLLNISDYIEKASKKGTDIICFPECSFNPSIKNPSFEKELKPIQKNAKKRKIFVIINGYFKNGKNIFNRTYLIDNNGNIVGFYNKIHLWLTEIGKIKPGKGIKVFDTKIGKTGLCVCWDLFFPKIFEQLKNKKAEIIFCPSWWQDNLKKESRFLDAAPIVLAYQNMCYFIYCNAFSKGKTSISQITSPWGDIAKIKYKEGMVTAKLYSNRIKRFKRKFKVFSNYGIIN